MALFVLLVVAVAQHVTFETRSTFHVNEKTWKQRRQIHK